MKTVYLVSLGCARNLVDSEVMLGLLMREGLTLVNAPEEADVIIINTCSFIDSAVDESIDTILELAAFKKTGTCRRLIVTGCLPQRFGAEIGPALPEVDAFLGTGAFDQIGRAVKGLSRQPGKTAPCILPDPNMHHFKLAGTGRVRTTPHMAYLKIAEGCSRLCTYCMIPHLRGKHKSRKPEKILAEASVLADSGAQEFVLIAQETTAYGRDLTPRFSLARLLDDLAGMHPQLWIRFLYGHPESLDEGIITTVEKRPNICSYFDIPVQHAADPVLRQMGRHYQKADLERLFAAIRTQIPEAALRTTVMVGFPGETDADFKELLQFVEQIRFDHLGAFIYSDADTLAAHRLPNPVPEAVARERFDQIMTLQRNISLQNNRKRIGKAYRLLVEKKLAQGRYQGRTFFQAPEVDGVTTVAHPQLECGRFVDVRINAAKAYDLSGAML